MHAVEIGAFNHSMQSGANPPPPQLPHGTSGTAAESLIILQITPEHLRVPEQQQSNRHLADCATATGTTLMHAGYGRRKTLSADRQSPNKQTC